MEKISLEELKSCLKNIKIGSAIKHESVTSSTQEVAHEWAKAGAPDGAVVLSEEQVNGKGRAGHSWHSPKGAGLWMSIILRPQIQMKDAPHFTLLTSLGVKKGIFASGINCPITIKWPNDLLIHDKKVCGILTEIRSYKKDILYMVIGIGINVNTSLEDWPPLLRQSATSLSLELGESVSHTLLLTHILSEIENEYTIYLKNGFHQLKEKWEATSGILDRKIMTRTPEGVITGIARYLNERGELVIQTKKGKRTVHSPCIELT